MLEKLMSPHVMLRCYLDFFHVSVNPQCSYLVGFNVVDPRKVITCHNGYTFKLNSSTTDYGLVCVMLGFYVLEEIL